MGTRPTNANVQMVSRSYRGSNLIYLSLNINYYTFTCYVCYVIYCSTLNTLLRLYIRDPRAYCDLRESKMLGIIPCPRTLTSYKNRVRQTSGINEPFLQWMDDEAMALALSAEGRTGVLVIDEMAIQVCFKILLLACRATS